MINETQLKEILSEKPSVRIKESLIAFDKFNSLEGCNVRMHEICRTIDGECFAGFGGASLIVRFELYDENPTNHPINSVIEVSNILCDEFDCHDLTSTYYYNLIQSYRRSIDFAGCGNINPALEQMKIEPCFKTAYKIPNFHSNKRQWLNDVGNIAHHLSIRNL